MNMDFEEFPFILVREGTNGAVQFWQYSNSEEALDTAEFYPDAKIYVVQREDLERLKERAVSRRRFREGQHGEGYRSLDGL